MADPFFGEIRMFGFTFAPYNWAFCDGTVQQVVQYQALASVIGFTYGGNGSTLFNLPNMKGLTPVGGNTANTPYNVGKTGGASSVTISTSQTPSHTHTVNGAIVPATSNKPQAGQMLAKATGPTTEVLTTRLKYIYADPQASNTAMSPTALAPFAGGGAAHENRQPYLVTNFCICMFGEQYPVRQ